MFAFGQQAKGRKPPARSHTWEHLTVWANEHPVSAERNIFSDPELHQALMNLLGNDDYKRLMDNFKRAWPADVIEGYLVLHGANDNFTSSEHVFVIIWLGIADSHVKVVFKTQYGEDWRPTSQYDRPNVQPCILRMIRETGPWSHLNLEPH